MIRKQYTAWALCRVAVVCLSLMLLIGCEKKVPERQAPHRLVHAMRIADSSGLSERAFPGRARAAQEVNLSFRVAGPLITFPVNMGDKVNAGDVVARIDPRDYETAIRTLQGQLERERATRKRAQADLGRLENVYRQDPGATSEAAIDRARQLSESAAAGVRSIRASVDSARDQLSYTELKAPFGGVIVETYVENFETVVAKQPILRLLDPSGIEFVINVPESLIGLAPYAEDVEVEFDALVGVQIPAKIKEISKEASQATRTYPVTLAMAQPEGVEILSGMAGEAKITVRPPESADASGHEIPATAIFTGSDPAKSYVWVIDEANTTLSRREVVRAGLSRFGVRITSGLEAGEWIVTKGVHSVDEGQVVRIIDTARGKSAS